MAAMSDLVVRLGAQTGQFDKKMRGSQQTVGRFGGAIGRLSKHMALFGVATAVAAGYAATRVIKANLEMMDSK